MTEAEYLAARARLDQWRPFMPHSPLEIEDHDADVSDVCDFEIETDRPAHLCYGAVQG